ncbi:Phosphate ABC transporter, periplasmic phosphate-binding protein PstS [Minicystis rosea]|nr:Phosphate ABC transporter, periplasmic phosphate-binding protein PstS [Minicystis rosea]
MFHRGPLPRLLAGAALVALGVGCGRGGGDESPLPGKKASAAGALDSAITGAGATFPYPLYTKWISEIEREHPDLRINYQPIGSGGGIRQITERTVDFGATDTPMTDEQVAKAPGIVHVPTCLGAVAIAYNVEGMPSGLKLTPEAVSGIFLGAITHWDDPAIAGPNPGAALPKKRITIVHRSDGSGTTKLFTEWLTAVSPAWAHGPGAGMSVAFPSGLGAKGNEGIAGQVSSTPGAIGYVEIVYAVQNKLTVAALRNAAGAFVLPTPSSVTAAGATARMPADLRGSAVDATGVEAYPISGFSYVLLYKKQSDEQRGRALVGFLSWAVHEGQRFAEPLSYARLPAELVTRVDAGLAQVVGPDDRPLLAGKP